MITIFGGLFLPVLASMAVGRRFGRKAFAADATRRPAGLGTVETVAFGLLGLLLAFTFSGAAQRLDVRRSQIVDEANAIGTAWLRLDLVPPAAQPALRDTFRGYVDARIAIYRTFTTAGLDAARTESARTSAIQNDLWSQAIAAVREAPAATVVLLPALNAMFDIAATRLAATRMHPPIVIYVVLGLLSVICGFLVGYEMGGSRALSWPHVLVLAFLLAFTFAVILDFEYPRLGLIRIDDFDDMLAQVRASMG
jgi:hypothetical protein